MQSRAEKIEEGGDYAERIVFEYLSHIHKTVKRSEDKFDCRKDGIADGRTVEVKLQRIWDWFIAEGMHRAENAFSIQIRKSTGEYYQEQYTKCMNVDRLIFVQIPTKDNIIRLWEAPEKTERQKLVKGPKKINNSLRIVAGILKKDCTLLTEFECLEIAEKLRYYDVSEW